MFENYPMANKMKLEERRISYVISYGLGSYFRNETISAINGGGYFTLSFDETTISQIRIHLNIHLR